MAWAEDGRVEMYDRDATNTSMSALVELCRALRQYRRDIVLAGGWAPYFLTQGYFDHCGSIDIDFVLRPRIVERYERIQRILQRLGYEPTENIFRFQRTLTSPATGNTYRVEVDFLTEPEAAEGLPREWIVSVQRDLRACIIEGSSIVFRHNKGFKFKAVLPGNGEASATINVADLVGSLTMKGLALHRMKDKDSYDIYAVAGFYDGGPVQASEAFREAVWADIEPEEAVIDSLEEIKGAFGSPTSQGPSAVARFLGTEDARTDSYQRIRAFFTNLET